MAAASNSAAEDRVNAFLLRLGTTPIVSQPTKTKKIHYSSKLSAHSESNKENQQSLTITTNHSTTKTNTNQSRVHRPRTTTANLGNKPSTKASQQNTNNSKLATCTQSQHVQQTKTSKTRTNYAHHNTRNMNRNAMTRATAHHRDRKVESTAKCKSSTVSSSNSVAPHSRSEREEIDEFAIQLQIKSTECEMLKTQIQELKKENETLQRERDELQADNERLQAMESEHKEYKQEIWRHHEKLKKQSDRILKLEHKLESCGVDPIALQSPQFMNEDTQKSIIFWRERLYKARQKLDQRKRKQQSIVQTANYWIEQLQQ